MSFSDKITAIVAAADAGDDRRKLEGHFLRHNRKLEGDDLCDLICAEVAAGYCWLWAPWCIGYRALEESNEVKGTTRAQDIESSKIDNATCNKMKADAMKIFAQNKAETKCLGDSLKFDCFLF
eukprot:TRINITY_DN2420_c0_g2_i2.p1 TRINITY_DN2420_c0_g2~~TRINITY_DN2420_c0_g2_i2.p1  ORF type:complete len:144 (-),score=25.49 TRINITY_DN2420_c0_g2_i2:47-415(-)